MVLKGHRSHGFAVGEGSEWLSKLVAMPWPFTCIRQSYWFFFTEVLVVFSGTGCVTGTLMIHGIHFATWGNDEEKIRWIQKKKLKSQSKNMVTAHLFMCYKTELFFMTRHSRILAAVVKWACCQPWNKYHLLLIGLLPRLLNESNIQIVLEFVAHSWDTVCI